MPGRLIICLLLWPSTAAAQEHARLPTKFAAAAAAEAHDANICQALIDVCDGIAPARPEWIERLSCRRQRRDWAICTFRYIGETCRARFVRSNDTADGWRVAFRYRGLRGSDVTCK